MESDSSEEEYCDENTQFIKAQCKRYVTNFKTFLKQREIWRSLIPKVSSMPFERKANLVGTKYEELLSGLHDRPRSKLTKIDGEEELDVFCDALIIGWRLWPDCWCGLQMILDWLTEKLLDEDVALIKKETCVILKEIAQNNNWPNNPTFGNFTQGQAKTLLCRISRKCDFAHATTVPIVRAMSNLRSIPSQPDRKHKPYELDKRRTCNNVLCCNIEKDQKFKKCSKCKRVAYCSIECQKIHWKSNHKFNCCK